jgi:CheY-like chemotaxis protein
VSASDVLPPTALVVAADEEMRILLRGLLQLHRVRVEAEAEGTTEALRLVAQHRPVLVVADTHLTDGTAGELIARTRALVPGLRFILVAPASRPPPPPAKEAAPDVLLLKPFRIQQFAEAIAPSRGTASGPT